MELRIKKPSLTKPSLGIKNLLLKDFKSFFVDQPKFSKNNFPISTTTLLVFIIIFSFVTFITYFLSNYIRVSDLSAGDTLRYISFLNYGLWLAFLLYIIGANILIVALYKILKAEIDIKEFFSSQLFIASLLYVLMRLLATVLILLDELLPFDLEISTSGFNFNLLTVLFIAQIWLVLIVVGFWYVLTPKKVLTKPWLSLILMILYVSAVWTLASP